MYINEEITKTKDAYMEEQLRQKLKGPASRLMKRVVSRSKFVASFHLCKSDTFHCSFAK